MWEKLQLEKKKQEATKRGKELSIEESKRLDTIRVDKERILDDLIFPAMANLTFFFESLDLEPILWNAFQKYDNVEELLGIKRIGPSTEDYGIFFIRLFRSILGIESKYDTQDIRLRLMREAMKVIYLKMMKISPIVYENITGSRLTIKYVGDEMGHALSRTDDISRDVKDPYDFRILEGDDKAKQREEFNKHAKLNSPNKTLDIDTKGILKRGY